MKCFPTAAPREAPGASHQTKAESVFQLLTAKRAEWVGWGRILLVGLPAQKGIFTKPPPPTYSPRSPTTSPPPPALAPPQPWPALHGPLDRAACLCPCPSSHTFPAACSHLSPTKPHLPFKSGGPRLTEPLCPPPSPPSSTSLSLANVACWGLFACLFLWAWTLQDQRVRHVHTAGE